MPKRTSDHAERIPDVLFVEHWQKAASLGDFAQAIGVPAHAASQYAAALRRAGIPLKVFKKKSRVDVEQLAALARHYAPRQPPIPRPRRRLSKRASS